MIKNRLQSPIRVINLPQIGINHKLLKRKLRKYYDHYQNDIYLLQQKKCEIIKSDLPPLALQEVSHEVWANLYQGFIVNSDIPGVFPAISSDAMDSILALQPTRKRLVSEYNLFKNNRTWAIERVANKGYEQQLAQSCADARNDYRMVKRQFKELPEQMFDSDLRCMLHYLAGLVEGIEKSVSTLHIVVHHTLIYTMPNQVSSNSPEGIHQDGMDFIVSALVVERNNIRGGESIIYGYDKETPIFATELQSGQGIFQPDLGTDLWHEVTKIDVVDVAKPGYRSTIGFDIQVVA